MPPLRIALVTSRFWPLIGGAERILGWLAEEWCGMGVDVTIVTAQWEPHWPREIDHYGCPVIRLPHSPQGAWGTLGYYWSLSRWLGIHAREFDAILVSQLRYDAFTVLSTRNSHSPPILLRADGCGTTGDTAWQRTARFGARIRSLCRQATAIIAPAPETVVELHQAGCDPAQIVSIANGVPIPPERTRAQWQMSRAILAEAQSDFCVPETTPVGIFVGRLHAASGLHELIRGWRKIVEVWPDARLWLVGEGEARSELYNRIRDCHLQYHVAMPGAFDDVTDLLYAADVFVHPAREGDTPLAILEAMAAGLPIVAGDSPGNRRLLGDSARGLLVTEKAPLAWAEAIADVLTRRENAQQRATTGRSYVEERYSARQMAQGYLELIERLVASKSTGN